MRPPKIFSNWLMFRGATGLPSLIRVEKLANNKIWP